MKPSPTIHVGFEIGTGASVDVPAGRHVAVTGQTQMSGKTTTLEAMLARSGATALAFITKRGEGSFTGSHPVQPYFRDRADWQFVDELLEAQLQEKNKFLRAWIIRICRDTRTLADVHRKIKSELVTAKGLNFNVYTQLDAYLDLIVPEIGRAELAPKLELRAAMNVMDVTPYPLAMQMLFIQSAIDWINERRENTVVVVPEAWETIPQGRGSPVKASARTLVRKGAGLGNLIWVDSQDMAGVDKEILRGCTVWLIGVQREANEIGRALDNIPAGVRKPKAADVATLGRGEFFVCWERTIHRTYVQPAWMNEQTARAIALGEKSIDDVHAPPPAKRPIEMHINTGGRIKKLDRATAAALTEAGRAIVEKYERSPPAKPAASANADDEEFTEAEMKQLDDLIEIAKDTRQSMDKLTKAIERQSHTPAAAATTTRGNSDAKSHGEPRPNSEEDMDIDAIYAEIKKRLTAEAPTLLKALTVNHQLEVTVTRKTITADESGALGMIGILLKEGFCKEPTTANSLWNELKRRWDYRGASARVYEQMDKLTGMGFVTKEADGYKFVPGKKVDIVSEK